MGGVRRAGPGRFPRRATQTPHRLQAASAARRLSGEKEAKKSPVTIRNRCIEDLPSLCRMLEVRFEMSSTGSARALA